MEEFDSDTRQYVPVKQMRNKNLKVHWNSGRCLPNTKQIIEKRDHFVRNKVKIIELLRNICPLIRP